MLTIMVLLSRLKSSPYLRESATFLYDFHELRRIALMRAAEFSLIDIQDLCAQLVFIVINHCAPENLNGRFQ